ncbi:hypothetical protein THRCLA_22897 [Thraustotheca clavata]|uniref:Impact N-terminal domain-containing protein n=1 Tax=Thraustotheca clavata TaxID=74557 RepID=A0A1V9YR87_9STRA|nr:hypothetical protein THRCLA_22897 [Thraustotheca clavata]
MSIDFCAGDEIVIMKNTFRGFVIALKHSEKVPELLNQMKTHRLVKNYTHLSYAFRVFEMDYSQQDKAVVDMYKMAEGSHDGQTIGAGDKLLYLLQRWDVQNVLLIVCRIDNTLSGSLIVAQTYKLVIESAKLALEQFALNNLEPSEAAKLAMRDHPMQLPKRPELVAKTIEYNGNSKMVDGVCRGEKLGRINHFLADKQVTNQENEKEICTYHKGLAGIGISKEEFTALKAIRMPPKELHMVLVCVGLLINANDVTWTGCKEMLNSSSFCSKLLKVSATNLSKKQVQCIRAVLADGRLVPELVRRVSVVGASLLTWVLGIIDNYDETQLGVNMIEPLRASRYPEPKKSVKAKPKDEEAILLEKAISLEPPAQPRPPEVHTVIPTDLFMPQTTQKIVDHGRLVKRN